MRKEIENMSDGESTEHGTGSKKAYRTRSTEKESKPKRRYTKNRAKNLLDEMNRDEEIMRSTLQK